MVEYEYFLAAFATVAFLCWACAKYNSLVNNNADITGGDEAFPIPIAESNDEEHNILESREERRFLVLTNLIHKRVIANVLPHENELSMRSALSIPQNNENGNDDDNSLTIQNEINLYDNNNADDNNNSYNNNNNDTIQSTANKKSQKENIILNPIFQSFRSSRRHIMIRHAESSSFYSPKECSICLEIYKENDEICWSRNEQCCHAYHLDCIVDWLMEHDECPLCRNDYLMIGNQAVNES